VNRESRLATAAPLVISLVLTAGCARDATSEGQPPYKPVASIDQIMDSIVIPSSQAIFDAVVYSNGELVAAPKGDDQWHALHMHALAVAEAANLLMMAPRAKDNGEWMKMAAAMNEQAVVTARAAEKKDLDGLLKAGSDLYDSCTACHRKYIPE
jgi:cytochrome c556